MKILVLTKSLPFPPRNGVELPLARFFERIGAHHEVDFLMISQDEADFKARAPKLPAEIGTAYFIKPQFISKWKRLSNEVTGKQPAFFAYSFKETEVRDLVKEWKYDFVWVNPPGNITFLQTCEALGLRFYQYTILGLNDLITSIYSKHLQEMWHRKIFAWRFLSFGLRSFWIAKLEKQYLYQFDYIHLQTKKEAQKAITLLQDPSFEERIIVCPNGIKEKFLDFKYKGGTGKGILYMTHLDGERQEESKWFIKKVWPEIKEQTNAELWLVGTPPARDIPHITSDSSIKVFGFVEDLQTIYEQVVMAVVPIFHNCGLINRILDGLTVGIPMVSTHIAAQTFQGIEDGTHLLMADQPNDFAEKTIELYQDEIQRKKLSKNGRQYALTCPTWRKGAELLLNKMEQKFTTHDW